MKSINELDKEMRDALIYWINDLRGNDPIIVCDPHNYLSGTEGLFLKITHKTRRDSYEAATRDAENRRRVILEILAESENGMTAREIAGELHRRGITPTEERNYAAPRLTELYKAGKVHFTSKKQCLLTGRYVAVWTVRKE
jgi:hypothetical protein